MIGHLERGKLIDPQTRIIMVIGASDSGKTTIVWNLSKLLLNHYKTAVVDLDMGQSHIGPPTTIGWAMMEPGIEDWTGLNVKDFYFTGTVTPFGSLLPSVTGARLMTERTLNLAEKVIIDTTGLISEPAGRVLKHFKIDIIEPDIILAVEFRDELSHILTPLRFKVRPEVIRIPVPEGVKVKTQSKRGEYRFERMMDYLREASTISLQFSKIGMRFIRNPLRFKYEFINRVVSLRDEYNRDIALGVIKGMSEGELKIFTPLKDKIASSIVIGRTVINMKDRTLKDS